jgi:hypothetical protein
MEKVKYTFEDGLEITGTIDQLQTITKSLGRKLDASKFINRPKGYYVSESTGLIKITEMNEFHLRRALLKRAKDYYAEVFNAEDSIPKFLEKFTSIGIDPLVVELFTELDKRSRHGK